MILFVVKCCFFLFEHSNTLINITLICIHIYAGIRKDLIAEAIEHGAVVQVTFFMHVCIHTYLYMHLYMHMMYTCTYKLTYIYMYMYVHMSVYVCAYECINLFFLAEILTQKQDVDT
jgi:hypothetical protein